jgi:hypothetical protein
LESRYGERGSSIVWALLVELGSLVLAFPRGPSVRLVESYAPLCENPFTTHAIGEPALRLRLLGPLMAYAMGLRGMSGAAVPLIANVALLACAHSLLRTHLPKPQAGLAVALLGTTLVTLTSQHWLGYQDSLASLGILLTIVVASPSASVPILALAMFADERAAAAVPLVLTWRVIIMGESVLSKAFLKRCACLGLAILAWFLTTRALLRSLGNRGFDDLVSEVLGGKYLRVQYEYAPLGLYYAFRAAWLLPLLAIVRLLSERRTGWLLILLAGLAAVAIPAVLVLDMSRVMSYSFPALLIAIVVLARFDSAALRTYLLCALLLNVAILPIYQVVGTRFRPLSPMPLSLARMAYLLYRDH